MLYWSIHEVAIMSQSQCLNYDWRRVVTPGKNDEQGNLSVVLPCRLCVREEW